MSIEWEEDDDFPFRTPPTGEDCLVCTTVEWLTENGIEGKKQELRLRSVLDCMLLTGQQLNLYRHLAPNAYPQLDDHVLITDATVVSQVYNVSCIHLHNGNVLKVITCIYVAIL